MINAFFIVWRECFEAVLIVGILYSYLKRQENPQRSMRFMWGGILAGINLSLLLALGVQRAQTELQGLALDYFEVGMMATAAVLMTHMCIWMKNNSHRIKFDLENDLKEALNTTRLIGVATITALAIAREGFELVMFFYGMGIEASQKGATLELLAYSSAGVVVTALTAWAYSKGLKIFRPKIFFQVTTAFLMVTASSLLVAAIRKLLQMDVLPTLVDQVWDTSFLLDERTSFGQFISAMTGYESAPSLTMVLGVGLYWVITLFLYFKIFSKVSPLSYGQRGAFPQQ